MARTKGEVIDLFVLLFVGAILLPIGITQFVGANTSGWSSTLVTIWDNIPIIGLVGVLVGLIFKYISK